MIKKNKEYYNLQLENAFVKREYFEDSNHNSEYSACHYSLLLLIFINFIKVLNAMISKQIIVLIAIIQTQIEIYPLMNVFVKMDFLTMDFLKYALLAIILGFIFLKYYFTLVQLTMAINQIVALSEELLQTMNVLAILDILLKDNKNALLIYVIILGKN